jgi:uncharacterized protein (DUF1499 family)
MIKLLLFCLLTGTLALFVAGQAGLLSGKPPKDLGAANGRLSPPSKTPNSVSSQASLYAGHPQINYATIDPLPLKDGDATASMRAIHSILQSMPGVTLVEQRPDYLYAEAQTRWLKFVDDLEFWISPQKGVIEVRSASRLGRKDFGVNRQRVETIRQAYLAQP